MRKLEKTLRNCPCCQQATLEEPAGSYEICPVCGWEDDPVQAEDPDYAGGANHESLRQAREMYRLSTRRE